MKISTKTSNNISLILGFLEATIFFIVPDVFLSWVALYNFKRARIACIWALIGAIFGGTLMYVWGAIDSSSSQTFLNILPAISTDMIASVKNNLNTNGITAMLLGPISGIPYKIYAVQSGNLNINIIYFILVTIPARLIRFLIITTISHLFVKIILKTSKSYIKSLFHAVIWSAFYIFYFITMPK